MSADLRIISRGLLECDFLLLSSVSSWRDSQRDWKRDARNTFMQVSLEVKYLTPLFLTLYGLTPFRYIDRWLNA